MNKAGTRNVMFSLIPIKNGDINSNNRSHKKIVIKNKVHWHVEESCSGTDALHRSMFYLSNKYSETYYHAVRTVIQLS